VRTARSNFTLTQLKIVSPHSSIYTSTITEILAYGLFWQRGRIWRWQAGRVMRSPFFAIPGSATGSLFAAPMLFQMQRPFSPAANNNVSRQAPQVT
jgi:hypothetical protein